MHRAFPLTHPREYTGHTDGIHGNTLDTQDPRRSFPTNGGFTPWALRPHDHTPTTRAEAPSATRHSATCARACRRVSTRRSDRPAEIRSGDDGVLRALVPTVPPELPAQPSLCGGLIWFQLVCLPFRFSSKKRPMNPRLSLSSCPPLRSDTYIELIHTPSCTQVTSNCKDREPMQTSSGLHLQAQGLTSQPFPTNFPSSSASRRYSGAHGIFTFQIPSQNTE